jgi:hypothetical protein
MPDLCLAPIEILSLITGLLDGFDISQLWLCGDSRLMIRLEHGGVTRFDIALAQTVTRRWPKIISQFKRLECLRIVPKTREHCIWLREVDFEGISPTLRHLELDFEHLTLNLLGIEFSMPDSHPDPIWSPSTEEILESHPFDLKNHFHNLETAIFWEHMTASHLIVPMLPKSLLKLRLPHESIPGAILQILPPFDLLGPPKFGATPFYCEISCWLDSSWTS